MLFITHALPKNLLVDEVVRIGSQPLSVLQGDRSEEHEATEKRVKES